MINCDTVNGIWMQNRYENIANPNTNKRTNMKPVYTTEHSTLQPLPRCCRFYRKPVPCHWSSILLFIGIVTLSLRCINASATTSNLNGPLPDLNEVFSKMKSPNNLFKDTNLGELDSSLYENIAHGFSEHEVIVPIRLHSETGEPVNHGHHFRTKKLTRQGREFDGEHSHRMRRSAGHSADDDFVEAAHDIANFSISAFGEEFHLHLMPYSQFIAPTFTLQFTGNITEEVDANVEDVPRHCFYSGTVNSNPDHTVVISVCGGMFGAFRTDNMDYLIQPHDLKKFSKSRSFENLADEVGTKPHRIYRRSTRKSSQKSRQLCAFEENSETRNDFETSVQKSPIDTERTVKDDGTSLDTGQHHISLSRAIDKSRKFVQISRKELKQQRTNATAKQQIVKLKLKEESRKVHRILRLHKNVIKTPEKISKTEGKSRQKRYLSYPRNVEVMVTADNEMLKTHGANLQHYVLTLMAIVHHVYLDASIGNYINIVLVKLVIIGDDDVRHGPKIMKNAHNCLRNFCQWQADENDLDDSHPNHHDTAVLITRQDICRTETACDTLGLAELGTMCDPLRSCSINEDNGLSTAFTIAHEIGHEFNAPHDNNDKCVTSSSGRDVDMHVMSPTLDHKSKPWSWSKCSARYITSFLDYGNGQCLLDDPPQRVLPLPREEPGQIYDVNQQCSFVYGKGVTHCGFMTTCVRLWCVSADRRHGCRTPHMPWADGTKCAPGMWCQRGKCVDENRHKRPVDGEWGEWSKFEDCSRTCGGGIRIAQRECNNPPPKDGGHYCVGKRKKFRSCNWQDCEVAQDYRAEQCASYSWSKYNRHQIRGIPTNAQWIPKYDGILLQDRCKLICQVKRGDQYGAPWYVLKPKVANGTPCGPDTHDICVEGICKRAGCDHVLNSNTREDECGVCGGDNSGCRTVKGVYNVGKQDGYNIVVEIPAGATNIVIEQRAFGIRTEDNNFLALKDSSGKFILNGNRNVVQFEHNVQKRSSTGSGYSYQFDYSGSDNVVERINSTKSIRENVTVLVLSAGALLPPNIRYRYNIPLPQQITYTWDPYGPWSPCSNSCQGRTKRKVLCKRSGDGQIVADHKCHTTNKPPTIIRSCNTHCEIKWQIKNSECSSRCGKGVASLTYDCIKITSSFYGKDSMVEIVRENECTGLKPSSVSVCHGECLPTSWHYGNWSECTKDCGGGTQTRAAECRDSNNVILSPHDCDVGTRLISRICNHFVCPQWVTSDFSSCLATCGSGVRHRRVWCRGTRGEVQSDSTCDILSKPPGTVRCLLAPCPSWKYDAWGKCSVTCGDGVTMRVMRCTDYLGRHVDDVQCDVGMAEKDTKPCYESECFMPSYIEPVISILPGRPSLINRHISYDQPMEKDDLSDAELDVEIMVPSGRSLDIIDKIVNDQNSIQPRAFHISTEKEKKFTKSVDTVLSRVAQWRTGHWTECSVTCGSGHHERYVSCRHDNGHEVSDEYCIEMERPADKEECNMGNCNGEWRSGAWSECSVSCGFGTRTRYVQCMFEGRYDIESRCNFNEKPETDSSCENSVLCPTLNPSTVNLSKTTSTNSALRAPVNLPLNPITDNVDTWRNGDWTECSSSCGSGNQKRSVVCNGECASVPKPAVIQLCNAGPCPSWQLGGWSKCSVTCGRGVSTRTVECAMPDGTVTPDSRCGIMKRPSDTMPCGIGRCTGRPYRWRSTHWSGCTVTCGRGIKQREVTCVDATKRVVPDEMCSGLRSRKPNPVRKCRTRRRCPRWHSGNWNKCSVTCGTGFRVRGVHCRYKRKTMADDYCDVETKPDDVETCNGTQCNYFKWNTADWSPCSMSCGQGLTRRTVTCVDNQGVKFPDIHCLTKTKPTDQQLCFDGPCTSYWLAEPWSECSSTCNSGIERRSVRCVYINQLQQLLSANNCDENIEPVNTRVCNINNCHSDVMWRVGPWSECSSSCGEGLSERQVVCFSRTTDKVMSNNVCESASGSVPDRVTSCQRAPCIPISCRHAQSQRNGNKDGEYYLRIRGQSLKVYCKDMNTRHPIEYITLPSGNDENFSEIYSFSLNNSETCPHNGSRNDHCACTRNPQSGKTSFQRIRFDIRTMKVIVNDFAFTKNLYGRPVGFGVAGDCYSRASCPQGEFRINLSGTGLSVSHNTRWSSYGRYSVQRISHSNDDRMIVGKCGGYCGQCRPDPIIGLILTHQHER